MKTTTALIFILVAIGLFFIVINPHYVNVKDLKVEANQYSEVLDNVEDLSKKRDELLLKYNAIPRAEIARVEKALPNHIDTVRLALDFDTIAAKYGISIKTIRTSEKNSNAAATSIQPGGLTAYETVTVTFNFVSSYDNFRKFMRDIESSLRIIDVRSISFSAETGSLYEYTVSIDTYWLK